MKEKVVALIIARGGSKRIKGKNFKKFQGKPVISTTIKNNQHVLWAKAIIKCILFKFIYNFFCRNIDFEL